MAVTMQLSQIDHLAVEKYARYLIKNLDQQAPHKIRGNVVVLK